MARRDVNDVGSGWSQWIVLQGFDRKDGCGLWLWDAAGSGGKGLSFETHDEGEQVGGVLTAYGEGEEALEDGFVEVAVWVVVEFHVG